MIKAQRYQDIVKRFERLNVAVLGDLMLDEYLWGRATRISPEAPVMVVEVDRETHAPGGAANVVANLMALGARVRVFGVVGKDLAGDRLVSELKHHGADTAGIVFDPQRRTTRKTRVLAHNQQALRIDREETDAIADSTAEGLIGRLSRDLDDCGALLISDYAKGVLTPVIAAEAIKIAGQKGILRSANPKPINAQLLAGCNILSFNQLEAGSLTSGPIDSDQSVSHAIHQLARRLEVETIVITRGACGLSFGGASGDAHHVPAHPVEVADVAGAGDTVISVMTMALVVGASLEESAIIANHAAACVVQKVGVATVTIEELLNDWDD